MAGAGEARGRDGRVERRPVTVAGPAIVEHGNEIVMAFHLTTRWGADEPQPSVERMAEVVSQLDAADEEHVSVSLTHESEWCLAAYPSGLLVWENLEEAKPRHMTRVPRATVLELWQILARGGLEQIEKQAWRPGYGSG